MYRLFSKTLVFLALIGIPIFVVEYRLRHDINNEFLSYTYRYAELFNTRTNAELLILGTSHAVHGIVPKNIRVGGYKVYNFAFNGAGPSFKYFLYNNMLTRYYPKPKLIIYEVNTLMFDTRIFWRRFSQDYKYLSVRNAFDVSKTDFSTLMLPYDFLRITHEDDLYKALKATFNKKKIDPIKIEYYDNGFVPYEKNYTIDNNYDQIHNSTTEINYLDTLTAHITSDAIPLVFVQTPEYLKDISSVSAKTENNKLISSIARKYGVIFLNYNDALSSAINYDKKYFSDPGHLNYLGARTFSGMLSRDINKLIRSKQLIL